MMISTKGRYALRFLADVAEHQGSGFVPLKDVAARQEISEKYLEIVVKELVKGGLYSVKAIIERMEGPLAPVACLEPGQGACPRSKDCRTLPLWQGLDKVISDYLTQFTLADLIRESILGGETS